MQTIGQAALATAAAPGLRVAAAQAQSPRVFCLFSKHLPELTWGDLGRAVRDAGFEGVDLTVRPGGHVLPERAAVDLPRAIEALTAQGVKVPMITTDLTSASTPAARPLLQAARAACGIQDGILLLDLARRARAGGRDGQRLEGLAVLARSTSDEVPQSSGGHRRRVGDVAPMDRLDARWAGYYFDPRHRGRAVGAGRPRISSRRG
jgi:hypothetical protein